MNRHSIFGVIACVGTTLVSVQAQATPPDSLEVTCDVDRTAFRNAAGSATTATFRLWDAESGGLQCGSDHVIAMDKILAQRPKGDKFDGQRPRKYLELHTVLGTAGASGAPVALCSDAETWIDVQVGTTTLTCDFSADPNSKQGVLPDAPERRRLQSVAFAKESNHSETCEVCGAISSPTSVRVEINSNHLIQDSTLTALSWDVEKWDTGCPGAGVFDGANPSRLTACSAGKYLIFSNITWNNSATGYRFAGLRVNGAGQSIASQQTQGDSTANSDSSITTVVDLVAGDYVEVVVYHNRGVPLEVSPASFPPANTSPAFGMVKLHD